MWRQALPFRFVGHHDCITVGAVRICGAILVVVWTLSRVNASTPDDDIASIIRNAEAAIRAAPERSQERVDQYRTWRDRLLAAVDASPDDPARVRGLVRAADYAELAGDIRISIPLYQRVLADPATNDHQRLFAAGQLTELAYMTFDPDVGLPAWEQYLGAVERLRASEQLLPSYNSPASGVRFYVAAAGKRMGDMLYMRMKANRMKYGTGPAGRAHWAPLAEQAIAKYGEFLAAPRNAETTERIRAAYGASPARVCGRIAMCYAALGDEARAVEFIAKMAEDAGRDPSIGDDRIGQMLRQVGYTLFDRATDGRGASPDQERLVRFLRRHIAIVPADDWDYLGILLTLARHDIGRNNVDRWIPRLRSILSDEPPRYALRMQQVPSLRAEAMLCLADAAERVGLLGEARQTYQLVQSEFPGTPFAESARVGLEWVNKLENATPSNP
ncbi:MAG: hypothetical protein L6Q92_09630 [Phycisphaerae bacterium]|nr:hypothetical protein [Phycisphaerae bacterium]